MGVIKKLLKIVETQRQRTKAINKYRERCGGPVARMYFLTHKEYAKDHYCLRLKM